MSLRVRLKKSKKGVSIIIGYVLLITFAVIIGVLVYKWMRTYVPQEEPSCPDGSTLFIESANYDCDTNILTLKITNNGNFNIGGYFIYGSDREDSELAPIDLTQGNMDSDVVFPGTIGVKLGSFYHGDKNSLAPGVSEVERYNLTSFGRIYSIEIIPFRWQTLNRKSSLISCSNSKLKEVIDCFIECTPDDESVTCASVDCGTVINNCFEEVDCGGCPSGQECNMLGECVDEGTCTDTCAGLGWECSSVCGEVCGPECPDFTNGEGVCDTGICVLGNCFENWENCDGNDANGCETQLGTQTDCGDCDDDCGTGTCVNGYCETGGTDTCNGVWEGSSESSSVECDGTSVPNCDLVTCQCDDGYVSNTVGGCWIGGSSPTCSSYCASLGYEGYPMAGNCRNNANRCTQFGEVYESIGNVFCIVDPNNYCCCVP